MTNAAAVSYAAVLLDLDVAPEMVAEAEQTFRTYPQLTDVLSNPTISEAEKFAVIDRLFPQPLQRYLHVVCRNERMDSILEIFSEYHSMERQRRHCAHAVLEYVTPLTDAQLSAMKKMVCAKTGNSEVQLELRRNPALLGGFLLQIGDDTYDRSVRRTIRDLQKSLIRR
ncbi:MAG: ATP synthase F1 subunit delta [Ruminococcus sp.]|uniref:ATP synthase F1 subunit delta n=1 Tax=Ruminococcus sp. TaxID=41978 RepID=UPI003995A0CD